MLCGSISHIDLSYTEVVDYIRVSTQRASIMHHDAHQEQGQNVWPGIAQPGNQKLRLFGSFIRSEVVDRLRDLLDLGLVT
jgi:hypothetical protein